MGVSGLLGLLKSIQKPCSLKEFRGQTIGVDAYGWLHRGAVSCAVDLALGKPTTRYVDYFMHRVRMLLHFGVIPYIVFDGDRLPSKAGTEKDRSTRRKESKKAGQELLRLGKTAQAQQELQKAVDITPDMARSVIEELKRANVAYVVAPYEADSQMAYLERKGIVNAILSEDSDLLVFGAKILLTKLDQYGKCAMIRREDFSSCRDINLAGWTDTEFRTMAILSGCDYLQGIPKMGLKTAHRLVRKYKTIDKIIRGIQLEAKMRVPADYLDSFAQAETTFLYQWVFCPELKRLVNFTPPDGNKLDGITYIGAYVEAEVAAGVADGMLNPMTKEIIRYMPPTTSARYSVQRSHTAPLVPTAKATPDKSIDTFFKPKRVPLAELDPNMFHPTLSQQELLSQSDRSWASQPAPQLHRTLSQPQVATDATPTRRESLATMLGNSSRASILQPSKRRRLCQDVDEDVSPKKSKFFTNAISSTPSLMKRAKKRSSGFELWSDDSIDEAMAAIVPDAIEPTVGNKMKSKVEVCCDEAETLTNHNLSKEARSDTLEPRPDSPKAPRLEIFAFEPGSTSRQQQSQQEAQTHEPLNTQDTEPSSVVEASPPPAAIKTLGPGTPPARKPRRSIHDSAVAILDTPTIRGSEDLLVAASDGSSNDEADVLTSPLPAKLRHDDDEGYGTFVATEGHEAHDNVCDEVDEAEPRLSRRLDLGRFVFGAR